MTTTTLNLTAAEQAADKAAGLPVAPCPACGKRANVGVLRNLGCCMTCVATIPEAKRVALWQVRGGI